MSTWITEVQMTPLYPGDTGLIRMPHEDFHNARKDGLHMACCRGTQKVRVLAPDGEVHCAYDRTDNLWRNVHPDSQAFAAAEYKEIADYLLSPEHHDKQRLKALSNIRRMQQVTSQEK